MAEKWPRFGGPRPSWEVAWTMNWVDWLYTSADKRMWSGRRAVVMVWWAAVGCGCSALIRRFSWTGDWGAGHEGYPPPDSSGQGEGQSFLASSWASRAVAAAPSFQTCFACVHVYILYACVYIFLMQKCLLRSNLSKRSKKHSNRKTPSSQLLSSPNVCVYICVCVYVCGHDICIYMHACMYLYIYAFIHMCMCMCMHICT